MYHDHMKSNWQTIQNDRDIRNLPPLRVHDMNSTHQLYDAKKTCECCEQRTMRRVWADYEWRCDHCSQNFSRDVEHPRCTMCNFDLCDDCFKKWDPVTYFHEGARKDAYNSLQQKKGAVRLFEGDLSKVSRNRCKAHHAVDDQGYKVVFSQTQLELADTAWNRKVGVFGEHANEYRRADNRFDRQCKKQYELEQTFANVDDLDGSMVDEVYDDYSNLQVGVFEDTMDLKFALCVGI